MRAAFAMVLSVVFGPVAAWADAVFLPGSGVGLEAPAGVTVTAGIPDFTDGPPTIWINELPPDGLSSFPGFRERFLQLGASDFAVGGAHGLISRGMPEVEGQRWRMWSVLLEAERESVIVTVRIAADDQRVSSEAVEDALRTITFRDADADRLSVLPFAVADFAGFRPITLGHPGASLLKDGMLELTRGPITPHPFAPQPVVTIIPSSRVAIQDAERLGYARRALLSERFLGTVHVLVERTFDAVGVQWAEIKAVGEQFTPVNILFLVRFGASPSGAILIVCTSPVSDSVDYSDQFRRIALSVRPRG